jgi:hypothetical protein
MNKKKMTEQELLEEQNELLRKIAQGLDDVKCGRIKIFD